MRQRKNNRLKNYDYTQTGYYFVTVCTQNHQHWFGRIQNGEMVLNQWGEITRRCWQAIPDHMHHVQLDKYMIMPNHFHGIIIISTIVGNRHACSLLRRQHQMIPIVMGSFKSAVTRLIHKSGFSAFGWQKSYYDRIIRSERELHEIREYIMGNPAKWVEDAENQV